MVPRILITGSPGSGKSTLMAKLTKDVSSRRIAGLSTPEIRRGGVRVGFKMIDLATGDEEILASTSGRGPTVGKYHVNVAGIDEMVQKIKPSVDAAHFVFIDEIGKMELFSSRFEQFIEDVFALEKPVVAVVHRNVVSRYKRKGRVFVLRPDNFEEVLASVRIQLLRPGEKKRSKHALARKRKRKKIRREPTNNRK